MPEYIVGVYSTLDIQLSSHVLFDQALSSFSKRQNQSIYVNVFETRVYGGFQLEFVNISRVINHMTCYKSSALIG